MVVQKSACPTVLLLAAVEVERPNLRDLIYLVYRECAAPPCRPIQPLGKSLGLRLPQYVVERAGLAAGDNLDVRLLDSGEILIRAVKAGGGLAAEYSVVPGGRSPQTHERA
ncbi:hypothetical protein CS8_032230 [Cupriavidus sp. 8B]